MDTITAHAYTQSLALLERAEQSIPLATQTFSKAAMMYPRGAAPSFVARAKGAHVTDVDGNEFIDLIMGLLSVSLGHQDPDVDAAVRDQLGRGISFSLPTALEAEVAERIISLLPSAELVRFGKNGSDATTAAIRLARGYTGRDVVLAGGYHGWHDWYIGATTRNLGVPQATQTLTQRFPYNDVDALQTMLERQRGRVAAIILEPMSMEEPGRDYLRAVRDLATDHDAVLVFDEVITGFRWSLGGAQTVYGVVPDLTAVGKGMGNGMPISAVTGRRDIMSLASEAFLSSTFGGEALSLAASAATIDKMQRENAPQVMAESGTRVSAGLERAITKAGLGHVASVVGHPTHTAIAFLAHPHADAAVLRTLYMKLMIEQGILTDGSHNMALAHDSADLVRIEEAAHASFETMAEELERPNVEARLGCPAVKPVFRVRES